MAILDSDKVLVADWFDKGHVEMKLDKSLTDAEYQALVDEWNENGNWDDIGEVVTSWLIARLR